MSEVDPTLNPFARLVKEPVPWVNGEVVAVPDFAEFEQLENCFTDYLPHNPSQLRMWMGRKNLEDILRPKKFFGKIADIELIFTDAPRQFMTQNYIQLQRSMTNISLSDASEHIQAYMFGFEFFAGLFSTGRGRVGTLNSFIGYAPSLVANDHTLEVKSAPIRRVVAKPSVITDITLNDLRTESINTALRLQKYAVAHPYRGAFETNRNT